MDMEEIIRRGDGGKKKITRRRGERRVARRCLRWVRFARGAEVGDNSFCVVAHCYVLLRGRGEKKGECGMTAKILDGTKIRDAIFAELKDEVAILSSAGIRPGLAAVLVGENPASQLYVKSKIAACEQLGMGSGLITPAA